LRREAIELFNTLWLCGYRPVKMEALEGQHMGVLVKAWVNVIPFVANHRRVFRHYVQRVPSLVVGDEDQNVGRGLAEPAGLTDPGCKVS
jgi:hypothetical protein